LQTIATTEGIEVQPRRRHSAAALVAFVLCAALQACVLTGLEDVASEPTLTSSFVRPDDPQEEIGAREHPLVVAKYGGEYNDAEAEKMLALIVGRLISVSDDPSRVFKVTILNSPKVNAFALPGGYVYVTRGLLALANDSSEIAAVIAHEMAHVSANHAIMRQEKLTGARVGEEVVTEVLGDSVAARVALAANQLQLADFSREQELQADAVGIRMIGKAGFDPYAAARFLHTMEAYQALKAGNANPLDDVSFLASHPTTPRRVELAKRHARFFGAPGVGDRERDRYLQGIDGLLFGDTADEGYVRGQNFSHSGLGVTFRAVDGSRIDNQAKAVIMTGPGEAATRFDATIVGPLRSLSAYLKSGWINGLVPESISEGRSEAGIPYAVADAEADGWLFRIKVFRIGRQVYRFITAVPAASGAPGEISDQITASFRQLTDEEKQALTPLHIRIVTVGKRDELGSLADQMQYGEQNLRMLRLINGLESAGDLQPGDKIKLITD
jgi:predicted Zn-dependent protease